MQTKDFLKDSHALRNVPSIWIKIEMKTGSVENEHRRDLTNSESFVKLHFISCAQGFQEDTIGYFSLNKLLDLDMSYFYICKTKTRLLNIQTIW